MLRLMIDMGNAPARTGTGVYARGLINALQRYSARDIDVTEAGISWIGNDFRPVRRLVYLLRLRKLMREQFRGADVVHFINIYVPRKRSRIATVGTITDLDAIQHPEVYTRRYSLYYDRTVRATISRADIVLTISDAVRSMILERYGLPEQKVAAVGIGLNPDFTHAVDAAAASEMSGEPKVLFVGRLEKKKNVEWLTRTVAEGVRSGALPKMQLVLAGTGGFGFKEIRAAMRDAGTIVRWVPNPDMQALATMYLQASVVVLPSFCEGFGLPLLEAMYCQKPIVASRIPASQEVAGAAARYFALGSKHEFYSALNEALTHGRTEHQASAAAERLQKFAWEYLVSHYVAVYNRAHN